MVAEIRSLFRAGVPGTGPAAGQSGGAAGRSPFSQQLQEALQEVSRFQEEADRAALDLVLGRQDSLHHLMITAEKAQLSLQLTVQVVNRVIQAYQEISRMQI